MKTELNNFNNFFEKLKLITNGEVELLMMPVFPTLGCKDYLIESEKQALLLSTKNPFSKSQYTNDEIINKHPRFGTIT